MFGTILYGASKLIHVFMLAFMYFYLFSHTCFRSHKKVYRRNHFYLKFANALLKKRMFRLRGTSTTAPHHHINIVINGNISEHIVSALRDGLVFLFLFLKDPSLNALRKLISSEEKEHETKLDNINKHPDKFAHELCTLPWHKKFNVDRTYQMKPSGFILTIEQKKYTNKLKCPIILIY